MEEAAAASSSDGESASVRSKRLRCLRDVEERLSPGSSDAQQGEEDAKDIEDAGTSSSDAKSHSNISQVSSESSE